MKMKPITPHLWFDKEAKEAAECYCAIFSELEIHADYDAP